MTSERKQSCGTCRYMDPSVPRANGNSSGPACRRFPPPVDEFGYSAWPDVKPTEDWCGEWTPTAKEPSE